MNENVIAAGKVQVPQDSTKPQKYKDPILSGRVKTHPTVEIVNPDAVAAHIAIADHRVGLVAMECSDDRAQQARVPETTAKITAWMMGMSDVKESSNDVANCGKRADSGIQPIM